MRAVDRTPLLDQIQDRRSSQSSRPWTAPPPGSDPRALPCLAVEPASDARGRRRGRAPGTPACAPTRRRRRDRSAPAARAWSPRSRAREPGRKARALPSPVHVSSTASSLTPPRAGRFPPAALQLDLLRRRRTARLRRRERGERVILRQRPQADDHHTSTPYLRAASDCDSSCEVTSRRPPTSPPASTAGAAVTPVVHHLVLLVRAPEGSQATKNDLTSIAKSDA